MRSDDRSVPNNGIDDKDKFKDDISADDLLKLLHESIENTADKNSESGSATSKDSNSALKSGTQSLAIDEDIYTSAEQELRDNERDMEPDDSDLDIDALINKYIKNNDKQTAKNDTSIDQLVKQIDISADKSESTILDDSDVKLFEAGNIESEEMSVGAAQDDFSTSLGLMDEQAPLEDVPSAQEKLFSTAQFDAIAAEPPSETEPDTDINIEQSFDNTTVFDTEKVKNSIDESSQDFSGGVDSSFEKAETEVFTPVAVDNSVDYDDNEEYVEPESEGKTQVYGEPDADEIDQTDLNLMIAFGMNDELKDTVGEKKASEIEADIEKKHEETTQMASVANRYEYTSRSQNTEILTKYKSQYYTLIMRIIAAIVLVGATFLLENFAMFGLELPSFMKPDAYPIVYAMIDLQFIVLCGALVYRQIIDGLKGLVTLKPTPESLTAFIVLMSVIYTIAICFITPKQGFMLFNLPVSVAVVMALVYEFMNVKCDVFSFNIVSTKRRKFVVTPVSDETESLEREVFSEYVPNDSQIIRVGKTDFVDGFFARVGENKLSRPIIGILIPVVLILAVVFFILSYVKNPNIYDSLTIAFLSMMVTMPMTAFIIYSFPYYRAARNAYDSDSAIIGEVSLNDYSNSSVISFEDKEVFPPSGIKVTSVKVYGNNRIDEIIYNLSSAFIKVGGPLADVFSQATHDIGHSDNVVLEEVEDDGLTLLIDDILVNIGKASYMEKNDYDPPYDAEDKRIETASSMGILYIAYQGQLAAKVYVQYTIDNEFEQILSQLYKTGMCVGIKSFDPNIDDLLLSKKLKAMKYPVKVIRSKTVEDIPHTFERCSSGIVSKRSVKDLLKTVALCERVNSAVKTSLIVKVLAMLIGIVVMVFVYSFASELNITSLYVALYQLIWVIPVLLISRFIV